MLATFVRYVCIALLVVSLACVACGARSGHVTDQHSDAGQGNCLPQAVRGVVGKTSPNTCVLEGRDAAGQRHLMQCSINPEVCVWFMEGSERCRCTEPNWAMTCPNGVPICAGWNLPFDFVYDVTFE